MIRRKSINRTILAVGAAAVLVGGTLAWFTSTDTVTNKFKAGGNGTDTTTTGVEIWEKFDSEGAGKILPGKTINKDVQVQNTATYNSLIRVKLTPDIKSGESTEEKLAKINLIFGDNVIKKDESIEGNTNVEWLQGTDGYYYYLGNVAPNGYTTRLLDDVQLDPTAGNEFKDVTFDVVVDAESIQSDNGAYADAWKGAGQPVLDKLAIVAGQTAGTASQIPGAGK
ncbi:MAG: BsaA family SipW-dependent biofilm matrix protein [Clostridium septicum]|uniref:BsaA family SipW-dependent biofilm matrix protein n=1 Tax=Clostridium septicum TaxID=1504 RepID=UPI0025829270|nr:BsaA family SipW-dependent biofilm matrix protein [Clostridium septicum]MDU1313714.1 BsaA family SipW-dependent biofilm matrix protein [Clostridium septicum]